jgi:catechol 2,3-dioxygenase-like lactoylglutathione lyase family enzyme
MNLAAFHPVLYVTDPKSERDFYVKFGFTTAYEGDDFPGFLAVECSGVLFGLSSNRVLPDERPYDAIRWQFTVDDVDEVVRICAAEGWSYEVGIEAPSRAHQAPFVVVQSPNGIPVWFEGPNQADDAS